MHKTIMTTTSVIFLLAGSSAFASAVSLDSCEAFQAEHGKTADCQCIVDGASGTVAEEIGSLESPEDGESLSQEATDLINSCAV